MRTGVLFPTTGVVLALIFAMGCAPTDGYPALAVIQTEPVEAADHPATGSIRIHFDRYLDPELPLSRVALLESGAARFSILTTYDPVDRALVIRPRYPLRPELGYLLTLRQEEIRAMDGGQLATDFELSFFAIPDLGENQAPEARTTFEADVVPIIEQRCGCHGPSPAAFPELLPDELINRPSARQPARTLVKPGQPLQSYLIQRLLTDYPGVRGNPKTISGSELRILISWVNQIGL